MHYAVTRLRGVRMAVVLVERAQLVGARALPLAQRLQAQLAMDVMLVARDNGVANGMRAYAEFDAAPYLYALQAADDIEWAELPSGDAQVRQG